MGTKLRTRSIKKHHHGGKSGAPNASERFLTPHGVVDVRALRGAISKKDQHSENRQGCGSEKEKVEEEQSQSAEKLAVNRCLQKC